MSSVSLYRRWRSQAFSQLVGQEHVTRTLLNALRSGRVAHAYLFCGPRGTGKTSTARILAKALNCLNNGGTGEPCNECSMCQAITEGRAFDLIEIDAASNRGIDDIRDLREKVGFAPGEARYKFYIIDEAHMLTTEAFNALLKTLEEPPPHTIIVLATTEAHRIPATITSRRQRFDFRRVAAGPAAERLIYICQQEGWSIPREAIAAVVKAAGGSLRDAQNLLDQVVARYGTEVALVDVLAMLGMSGDRRVAAFAGHVLHAEVEQGLRLLHAAVDEGVDLRQFLRELLEYLRGLLLVKLKVADALEASADSLADMERMAKDVEQARVLRALKQYSQVEARPDWQTPLPLELTLVELSGADEPEVPPTVRETAAPRSSVRTAFSPEHSPGEVQVFPASPSTPTQAAPAADLPPAQVSPPTGPRDDLEVEPEPGGGAEAGRLSDTTEAGSFAASWGRVLDALHRTNKTIEALLRSCDPRLEDGTVVLDFHYPYHRDKMDDAKFRRVLEDVLAQVMGRRCEVQCQFTPRDKKTKQQAVTDDPLVRAAQRIFDAKVVDVQS